LDTPQGAGRVGEGHDGAVVVGARKHTQAWGQPHIGDTQRVVANNTERRGYTVEQACVCCLVRHRTDAPVPCRGTQLDLQRTDRGRASGASPLLAVRVAAYRAAVDVSESLVPKAHAQHWQRVGELCLAQERGAHAKVLWGAPSGWSACATVGTATGTHGSTVGAAGARRDHRHVHVRKQREHLGPEGCG
jgi:hypothetical protein